MAHLGPMGQSEHQAAHLPAWAHREASLEAAPSLACPGTLDGLDPSSCLGLVRLLGATRVPADHLEMLK